MTDPKDPHSTSTDDELLAIPAFLRRDETPRAKTRSADPPPRRTRRAMPPQSMVPVLRAVKRGRDTFQKLRASLGDRYSDTEIRDGLAALTRIASIYRVGRRYLPITRKTPPPAKRP